MRASAGSGANRVDPLQPLEARKMQIRSACKKMALSDRPDEPASPTGRTPVVGKKGNCKRTSDSTAVADGDERFDGRPPQTVG